jgi:hypothetical protein
MSDNDSKIGAGHAAAMFRLGLNELRNTTYPDSNVAQRHAEYGIYGTATPQEVMEAKRRDEPARDDKDSVLADRLQQAEARDDRGRDSKEMERE